MNTRHEIFFENAARMTRLPGGSIDLTVTSPPYPMIEMWDGVFKTLNPDIAGHLKKARGAEAFEAMHRILDPVWGEVFRVLKPGGILCVNIGDATRTLGGRFALYTNHARILGRLLHIGFSALPAILWRKQTNAPNKFMGSGMMPPGAYVTLEHEYILVLRKGGKREFYTAREKDNRRESAYFWEERNIWFSDVWMDLKGTRQKMDRQTDRKRSGAFPFELAYRLVNMFSVKGDTVLDPFLGSGTTMAAAMASGRNSVGFELDGGLREVIASRAGDVAARANRRIHRRLSDHLVFVRDRRERNGAFKYANRHYGFPVVTRQESDLLINDLLSAALDGQSFEVTYDDGPQQAFVGDWESEIAPVSVKPGAGQAAPAQRDLFDRS